MTCSFRKIPISTSNDILTTLKYCIVVIIILIALLPSEVVLGQGDKPSPVQFHGSNRTFGQYANQPGVNSEIPASLWRNDLNMTLTVYGIPVSASFFLTSEQTDYRQSINNFRIYFDLRAMAMNKAKTYAMNKAKGMADKKLPWMMRFMDHFRTLEVGRCRPNYTDLTLRGISLDGVNIEFNPSLFYAAFATGRTKKSINPSDSTKPTYEQKLLFGKLGVGKKNGSHLYFTYMQAEDQPGSLVAVPDSLFVDPEANVLLGTEGKISLFDDKFALEGEAAVSMLTRDVESPKLDMEDSGLPQWIINFTDPRMSSSVDFAYAARTNLTLSTTRIMGSVRMVGSGFSTLGNPNLVNDIMSYDARIDQSFSKRQINLGVFFRENKDNLIEWKKATTTTTSYGVSAGIMFKKLPYLQLSYTPFFQKNNSDSLKVDNAVQVFNLSMGYSYPIGKVSSSTGFNFFYNNSEMAIDTLYNGSKNLTYTLNESLTFKIPLSLSGGISWNTSEFAEKEQDILTLLLSATHKAFKKWGNTFGVRYSNQIDEQTKIGIYWSSRIALGKFFDFDMRLEENLFRDKVLARDNFDEFIARGTLVFKW